MRIVKCRYHIRRVTTKSSIHCCLLLFSRYVYCSARSPTKPTSKLELLGNVKNQMSSWLGSGIPGLRKSDSEVVPDPPAELLQDADAKESFKEKEDDNSRWELKFTFFFFFGR